MNDVLTEQLIVFRQADYAEVLRNSSSEQKLQDEARVALSLINWKNITYTDVLNYTQTLQSRKIAAYNIYDLININELSLEKYRFQDIYNPQAQELLNQSKIAFYSDRYSEAEDLIKKTRQSIESKSSEASILNSLSIGVLGFIQKYWVFIVISLVILFFFLRFSFRKISLIMVKRRIVRMKKEEKALNELMKKTQIERFKENSISGIVYNIRMKKYQTRLSEIKEELPVLEKRAGLKGGVDVSY
jgi:hypothetical protein